MMSKRLKLKKSPFDIRDSLYKSNGVGLRRTVDLREWDSPIEDQGDLGSCVGNAFANAYELMQRNLDPAHYVNLSRLFIYYNSREMENSIMEDAGVLHLRHALKALKLYGICREDIWPYIPEKFDDKPSPEAYADGVKRQIKQYESLSTITDMLEALAMNKPIVLGMNIYQDFLDLTPNNSIIKVPEYPASSLGTHALIVVGYSLAEQHFLVKNSFGTGWGMNGYAWMPFEYVKSDVFERWIFDIADQ